MKAILVLQNLMPLCFRSSRSKESAETLTYIPGTTLLGGLAAAHHRLGRSVAEFTQFFTLPQIRFGNLYPANFKKVTEELVNPSSPIRPLPLTARSCKRFGGFRFNAKKEEDDRHGVVDHLIFWALFALSKQQAVHLLNHQKMCKFIENDFTCDQLLDHFTDSFYWRGYTSEAIGKSGIESGLVTRTGISRGRGAVQEEILYNRKVLKENQTFWGTLAFSDGTIWKNFQQFLEEASHHEMLYLGNNRTRGLGKVIQQECSLIKPNQTVDDVKKTIEQRVNAFTSKMQDIAGKENIHLSHTLYIPITLQSHAILRESPTRYRTVLDETYFKQMWGLHGFELVYQSASTSRIMGWNAVLGLPKVTEIGIKMGSVFLLGYTGTPDDTLWQALANIENNGIGERRQEGFGEVTIADPFHMEVQPL